MRIPSFPNDPGWHVYGLDAETHGEPFLQGYGHSTRPLDGTTWRHDHVTLHYGDIHDWNVPSYRVISAPHLGESALNELHSGLGKAGFVFGMSGTGHVSGAPVPPSRMTVYLDDVPVEAEAWQGEAAEVAWIVTADTWITLFASKNTLTGIRLNRITGLDPLIEARGRKLGLPGH